jgi:molybdopterin-guanine dinucleotide biosynthesis protein A
LRSGPGKTVEVVILAGSGKKGSAFAAGQGAPHTALLEIGGKSILARMLEAFGSAPEVSRIIVVADPPVREALPPGIVALEAGGTISRNLATGLGAAREEWLIVTPADIPFLSAEMIAVFLQEGFASGGELVYPIVERRDYEARFPGGKRTYAALRGGTFTGGNLVLAKSSLMRNLLPLVENLFEKRKNPFALAGIFGYGFILKLLFHGLTLSGLEARASELAKGKVVALPTKLAELAFDIDKPEDLEAARGIG